MAINVSFNGSTIFKPGAYSRTKIDLGGGFPLGPTGLVGIFGESERGKPGSSEILVNNVFTAEQIPEIQEKYGSGPLVDAVNFLFAPASDGAIPSGAQAVYIYKTNASTQASYDLSNSYGTLESREYGIGGNRITFKHVLTGETAPTLSESAAFDETAVTSTSSFDIQVDGGEVITVAVAGGYADNDAFVADVGTWTASGITFTAGGSDGASTLTISRDADVTAHELGYGRSFELQENTNTPLDDMNIDVGLQVSEVEPSGVITLTQTRDLISESDTVGGDIVIIVGFDSTGDDATSASVTVDADDVTLAVVGGSEAGSTVLSKSAYDTIGELIDAINIQTGWSASVTTGNEIFRGLPTDALDQVSTVGALSESGAQPARLKKDAYDTSIFFEESGLVSLDIDAVAGLMDNLSSAVLLTGGVKGASSAAEMANAVAKFQEVRLNSVVPLFSQDATADALEGLTDSSSSYTIDAIHQLIKTHLSLMSTTKRKSERQGYLSFKGAYADCKSKAGVLADQRVQLAIQDVRQADSGGNIKWFQPWSYACMLAGARGGSPVGTPLTFKFMNVSGVRHTSQAVGIDEEDVVIDFNPTTQGDDAIQAGITFMEAPQSGGFRTVVDNTTYSKDGNWVYNRGHVMYAADILAFDFRDQLENILVGKKNTVQVNEVKSLAETILGTYLAQGITVSTADAPNGFKQLTVQLNGNTITVNVVVKLVEGIDYVLASITLQRAQATA